MKRISLVHLFLLLTYPLSNSRGKALEDFVTVSNLEGLPVEAPAELLVARPGGQAETSGN